MAIRVYWETVKKWARKNKLVTAAGATSMSLVTILFFYLASIGAVEIIDYSPDYACAGTLEEPCYAYFTIKANNDSFIYPIEYDPYGRNTPFIFNPGIKSWKLERSWGEGWREIKLNETCSGTWCGGKSNTDNKFSYAFRDGREYKLRLTVIKNNPWDYIKWGAWDLDPAFLPIGTEIQSKEDGFKHINITTKEKDLVVLRKSGNEKNYVIDKNNVTGEICITPDKTLYKDLNFKLKNDSNSFKSTAISKVDGKYCYDYKTNMKTDDELKIGENSIVAVYQDMNKITGDTGFSEFNITLFKNVSGEFTSQVNDIWVTYYNDRDKFGANDSSNLGVEHYKYILSSDSKIYENGNSPYVINPTKVNDKLSSYYESHVFNFGDICGRSFECTGEGINTECNYTSNCNYNTYNESDLYYLEVDFMSDSFIDPQYLITSINESTSAVNVTCEYGEYCHLNVSDEDIIIYMPFDVENSTNMANDWTDNNNNHEIVGPTMSWVSGKYGGAYDMISDDWLTNEIVFGTQFTLAFWINFDQATGTEKPIGHDANSFLFERNNGKIRTYIDPGDSYSDVLTWNAGQWYHVVMVRDGTSMTYYRDGASAGSGTVGSQSYTNKYFGTIDTSVDFEGLLDEIIVFNRSLDSTDAGYLYANTYPRFSPTGTHLLDQAIAATYNKVNVTTVFANQTNANMSLSIYDGTTTSDYQDIITDIVETYSISTAATDLDLTYKYLSDTNKFWSPILTPDITIDTYSDSAPPEPTVYLLLNQTFDDSTNLSKDYSTYDQTFSTVNTVAWADSDVCKWYGCADFNTDLGYLESSVTWNLSGGYAQSMWVYITENGDTETQGYTRYGTDTFGQYGVTANDDNYGFNIFFSGEDDAVNLKTGDGDETPINVWTHYFAQYSADGSLVSIYRNGEHFINSSVLGGGVLNWSTDQEFFVGRGMYSADMDGYLDELLIWNRGNFTADEIKTIYDEKSFGTPPNVDLYVDTFKYDIPFDFSATNNTIDYTAGTMDLNITIANYGADNANQSTIRLIMDGTEVCNYPLTLNAWESDTTTCAYTMVEGFHSGYIYIDSANNTEANTPTNNITVYVPLVERINFYANMSSVNSNCDNETGYLSSASENACDWSKSFAAAGTFNPSYTCNSADPYAGNGRTYAYGCFRNDYNESFTQCIEARKHLQGWSNRSIDGCTDVQAFHQYMHVGIALNTMFPILTEEQVTTYSNELLQKCMLFTNFNDVQPYYDNQSAIIADNGKGFGSGMAGLCYNLIGLDKDNPSLLLNYSQLYYKPNIVEEWSHREDMFMHGYKNETDALYQEGWAYTTYALPHLTENVYFRKRFGISSNVTIPQTAYCSALTDYLYTITDGNYFGDDVIGGDDFYIRAISRGDSESYKQIDDSLYPDWSYITMMATMCDDDNLKKSVLWLRNWAYSTGDADAIRPYPTIYSYFDLADQVDGERSNPVNYISKGIYDNSNDIMLLRSNFSYFNDTIVQIDAGEEIGGGHSTAQGYFISAFGEPFLDYVQVPYEDDVRDERWQNGISLDVTTQASQGLDGHFEEYCGDYSFNQYYGSKPTENLCYYPTIEKFPDERQFISTYAGDQEDYLFTADVNFAGSYVWRPYYNVLHPVEEYFVKVGDVLLKRSRVSGNGEDNTQENFISIDELFTTVNDSVNFTMNRNNITGNISMKTNLVYSNTTMTLKGGKTNVSLCFAKTNCEGSNQGNSNYTRRYLESSEPDADFIFYHHWFMNQNNYTIINLTNGINIQNTGEYVYFDTDNTLTINESLIDANGWAAYYDADDNKQGGFNTTDFNYNSIERFTSDIPVQFHIDVNDYETTLTITTTAPTANRGVDEAQDATVIIDLSDMVNNTNFVVNNSDGVVSSGTIGNSVNFVASGENTVYTITGDAPADSCTYSGSGDHTFTAEDNCVISSEVDMDGNSWYCRGTGTLKGIGNIVNYASGWIFGPCVAEN